MGECVYLSGMNSKIKKVCVGTLFITGLRNKYTKLGADPMKPYQIEFLNSIPYATICTHELFLTFIYVTFPGKNR